MTEPKIPGGYIIISRKIVESEIFNKPPLYLKVWMYLLSRAQHADYKSLKRGQLRTSIPEIMDACSWKVGYRTVKPNKHEIFRILEWLRSAHESDDESNTSETMITTTKATQGLLVNIDNYCFYQTSKNYERNDESNNEKPTNEPRTQRHRNNINKNVKNEKNDKEEKKKDMSASPSSPLSDSVNEIWDHYVKTFDGFFSRISLTSKRKTAITARLKDGLTTDDIKLAITNIRNSPFHCGQNENSKFYADITFICRSLDKVEEWINFTKKVTQFPRKQEGQGYAKGRNNYNYDRNQTENRANQDSITGGQVGRIKPPNYAKRSQL